ncbi:MAG: 1-deoxy-D-xylulose-5-phosphate synthase N-terminal domain-containing protein, partial [Methylococcales bacterium]
MNSTGKYPLLDQINTPEHVRKLSKHQLASLSAELRDYLTQTVSISGGHFSAGLGTVELTVALHYVYNTPVD